MAEIGWKPVHVMNYSGSSIGGALKPAGLENAVGLISASYAMDPTDPTWSNDPAMKKWAAFMDKWVAGSDKTNNLTVYAYSAAWTMVEVLRRCGDDLTRANIMRQATSLKDLEVPLLLPGIRVNTSPKDYYPIEQMQLMRFTGERLEQFGPPWEVRADLSRRWHVLGPSGPAHGVDERQGLGIYPDLSRTNSMYHAARGD